MIKYLTLLLALPAFAPVYASQLHEVQNGQGGCKPWTEAVEQLEEGWGEVRYMTMLGKDAIFEVFANPESQTWTVLRTGLNGISCVVVSGEAFEFTKEPEGIDG